MLLPSPVKGCEANHTAEVRLGIKPRRGLHTSGMFHVLQAFNSFQ
jgi:hypothetical protein